MVTLRTVNRKPALQAFCARHKAQDRRLGEHMLEISGELALLFHIRCQEGKRSFLHFAKGDGVNELALALMRNVLVGPTCWMVCAAH